MTIDYIADWCDVITVPRFLLSPSPPAGSPTRRTPGTKSVSCASPAASPWAALASPTTRTSSTAWIATAPMWPRCAMAARTPSQVRPWNEDARSAVGKLWSYLIHPHKGLYSGSERGPSQMFVNKNKHSLLTRCGVLDSSGFTRPKEVLSKSSLFHHNVVPPCSRLLEMIGDCHDCFLLLCNNNNCKDFSTLSDIYACPQGSPAAPKCWTTRSSPGTRIASPARSAACPWLTSALSAPVTTCTASDVRCETAFKVVTPWKKWHLTPSAID